MEPLEQFENTEEEMTVSLTGEDGEEILCSIVTIFSVLGRDYIALAPVDTDKYEEGTYWYYGYSENPDDPNEEPKLRNITDEAEFEAVDEAFDEYLDDQEFDEIL